MNAIAESPEIYTTTARLAALQGRRTAFEAVMTDGKTTYLLGYFVKKTKSNLFNQTRWNAASIVKIVGQGDGVKIFNASKAGFPAFTIGNWTVKWSGRTEREAIIENEHTTVVYAANMLDRKATGNAE